MEKPLQVRATLQGISFTADGGIRMSFITSELTQAEKVIASEYHQQYGHLLFRPNEFSTEDIPKADAEDKRKTPSARLRASLFKLWKLLGEPTKDFEGWYRVQMESLIDKVHTEIEETKPDTD